MAIYMMRQNRTNLINTDFKNTTQSALNADGWYAEYSAGSGNFPTCGTYGIEDSGSSYVYKDIGTVLSTASELTIVNTIYIDSLGSTNDGFRVAIRDGYGGWRGSGAFDCLGWSIGYGQSSTSADMGFHIAVYTGQNKGGQVYSSTFETNISTGYLEITLNVNFDTKIATVSSPSFNSFTISLPDANLNYIKAASYIQIYPSTRIFYSEMNTEFCL